MGRSLLGKSRSDRGQALAEFLVILPVLLLLLMAVVGFGQAVLARMIVTQAAHRAARLGAVLYGDSALPKQEAFVRTREAALATIGFNLRGEREVIITQRGDDLSVRVRYGTPTAVPFMRPWLGDRITAEHVSTYRVERDSLP